MPVTRPLLLLGLGLLAAQPVTALAQPAPPPPPASPGAPPAPPPAPLPGEGAERTEARVTKRIEGLHKRLRITAEQEPAFQAFGSQMAANALNMKHAYDVRRADAPSMTAPQNLTTYADLTEAHAKEARSMVAPFQALYAQLSPEQQRTADKIFSEQAERMGRRARKPQ